ncbi:MAG: hypothetical protein LBT66_07910 [Methanobrevibacter sp.]|jgi:hypothetical protein|nr:hypothetical protein [Candidatus Methanovirga meridionalis]
MDYAEGTVKKYIRKYSRRLKDGKKKKYQTEQVQIMLPKKNDIFQDDEEVIVMNKEAFEKYEKLNSTIEKQKNIIESLKEKVETLKIDQEVEFEEKTIDKNYLSLQDEHDLLKENVNLLEKEVKYYKKLNEKLRELILKLT